MLPPKVEGNENVENVEIFQKQVFQSSTDELDDGGVQCYMQTVVIVLTLLLLIVAVWAILRCTMLGICLHQLISRKVDPKQVISAHTGVVPSPNKMR